MTKAERKADARAAYEALMKFYPLTLDNHDGEIWRDISGYEGRYQISNFGRIKSFWKGKTIILSPALSTKGYLYVRLSKNDKQRNAFLHRLTAMAFIPAAESKKQVNHIDGHKLNNHVLNLEWTTATENNQHAHTIGLQTQGGDDSQAKLTNEQAEYVRGNPNKLTNEQLAKLFGVCRRTISAIQRGLKYKNAGGKIREAQKHSPRLPDELRVQIRAEYVKGSTEFGSGALAKKYGVNHVTILNIVHERDD